MKTIISVLTLTIASQVLAAPPVIYGEDNRKDVFESASHLVELSKSTAAMIPNDKISVAGGIATIKGETLEARGVCADERFASQMTAANCSGFLVSENVLVTAGHCIKNEMDCSSSKWVFDYKMGSAKQNKMEVDSRDVFSCKKIISRTLDQYSKDDFAVIELDRKVNRRPLSFRRSGNLSVGESVVVIGHPTGLPTKIADGATVRTRAAKYFIANLDTFGGNSGSAVFNARTGEVEGILVRGENDYVRSPERGCMVPNKCADTGCRGEDVVYITNIKALENI